MRELVLEITVTLTCVEYKILIFLSPDVLFKFFITLLREFLNPKTDNFKSLQIFAKLHIYWLKLQNL
jgi:hypothetical protein